MNKFIISAPLFNTTDSIKNFQFPNGFYIKEYSLQKAQKLFNKLHGTQRIEEEIYFIKKYKDKIITVEKEFPAPENSIRPDGRPDYQVLFDFAMSNTQKDKEELFKTLRILRLILPGGVWATFTYSYLRTDEDVFAQGRMGKGEFWDSSEDFLKINDDEVTNVQNYFDEVRKIFPFEELNFLKTALKFYELSYESLEAEVNLLMISIAWEVLFNNSKDQITYTLSRNIATLLSENKENGSEIFKEVKKLYSIRSDIVHTGETKRLTKESLVSARGYLRKSILALAHLNLEKGKAQDRITESAFGEFSNIFGKIPRHSA